MRTRKDANGTTVWLSALDTHNWAHKPGARWPCSALEGNRLRAEFDARGDLIDVAINGRTLDAGAIVPGDEFNACISDHLRKVFGSDHPAIRD